MRMKTRFHGAAMTIACVATVALATRAQAAPAACSLDGLAALHVPDVTIVEASTVPPAGTLPEHCLVKGTVITRGAGAPEGKAGFLMQLPTAWKQRFFFMGVGGNAGNFTPAVNPADRAQVLGKGYATIVTDTGHTGNGSTAAWVLGPDGKRDTAKITDFFFRAAHDVTISGKRLAEAYYAGRIEKAYFDGCSTGGRMAMMEAERFPTDYDGIIAGDPAMDYRSTLGRLVVQKAQLSSPASHIPATLLPMIDKAVLAACDMTDGVKDNLIQNPARCAFKPETLQCRAGATTDCLSAPQVATLRSYLSPIRDTAGHVVYPGMSPSDLAGVSGLARWTVGATPADFSNIMAPWGTDPLKSPAGWNYARESLSYWLGRGPTSRIEDFEVDPRTNTVSPAALKAFDDAYAEAMTRDPAKMQAFIRQGRKMIMYHGFSDPAISPFRTVMFYEELAKLHGGYSKLQENVRLFMIPGMHHCSAGPGPENFDTLTALENWVERGTAPDGIIATATAPGATKRTMPLCRFPEQAKYRGAGDVNDAANWSCTSNRGLLQTALAGH